MKCSQINIRNLLSNQEKKNKRDTSTRGEDSIALYRKNLEESNKKIKEIKSLLSRT